ncbi:MAG: hypothetical protein ACO39T_07495 [Flavobacteriaceae bacterium]|jgi:hypothetical protein
MTLSKRFRTLLFSALSLLLIPLTAMQFTNEVQWSLFDFVIMGALLTLMATGLDLILRKIEHPKNRIVWIIALFFVGAIIWAELAVGIFNTPFAGT